MTQNPKPNTNPNSDVAVRCLKIKGLDTNCREMICPVPPVIIIIKDRVTTRFIKRVEVTWKVMWRTYYDWSVTWHPTWHNAYQ